MKILLTGAGGQVGTDLIPALTARGHEVVALDIGARPDTCPADVEWLRADVTLAADVHDAVKAHEPDRILHFAAILSARGEQIPLSAWRVNMDGTENVLEAARLFDVGQVFFTSTIAAFGPGLPDPVGDDVPMVPNTIYGVSKVAGELLGRYYQKRFGLDFRGVRFPGLINAGIPGGGTSDYALFMFIEGLRTGQYDCFVGPESRIPFMYMPDALRAVIELSDAPRESLGRCVYNIAAMSPSAEEIADAARARIPDVKISFTPDPKRQAILDSWPAALDDSCARKDWGWKHEFDLEAMADDLMPKVRDLVDRLGEQPIHA